MKLKVIIILWKLYSLNANIENDIAKESTIEEVKNHKNAENIHIDTDNEDKDSNNTNTIFKNNEILANINKEQDEFNKNVNETSLIENEDRQSFKNNRKERSANALVQNAERNNKISDKETLLEPNEEFLAKNAEFPNQNEENTSAELNTEDISLQVNLEDKQTSFNIEDKQSNYTNLENAALDQPNLKNYDESVVKAKNIFNTVTDDEENTTKENKINNFEDGDLEASLLDSKKSGKPKKNNSERKQNKTKNFNRIAPQLPARFGDIKSRKQCLTGYMTDVQNWVDENGNLTPLVEYSRALDASMKTGKMLTEEMQRISRTVDIRYISLANCKLKQIPMIFSNRDNRGQPLSSTVEYLTLYGNDFATIVQAGVYYEEIFNATGTEAIENILKRTDKPSWVAGLTDVGLPRLKELDLRRCKIQQLNDNIFRTMPNLEALYLGENHIKLINARTFNGLTNLRHLDLSRNINDNGQSVMKFESENVLANLENLKSLDLSYTAVRTKDIYAISKISKNLERMSLCNTGLSFMPNSIIEGTELRYLDVSGNNGVLSNCNFTNVRPRLEVLYAEDVGLRLFDAFQNFENLRILNIRGNEIGTVSKTTTKTLKNLEVLNLSSNRLTTWYDKLISWMPKLKFLDLSFNNINLISREMIDDISNITFVGLSGNFIVCNCQCRELFEIAYQNQDNTPPFYDDLRSTYFHRGFIDVMDIIRQRNKITRSCDDDESCEVNDEIKYEYNFTIYDYKENSYQCTTLPEGQTIPFHTMDTCRALRQKDTKLEDRILESRTKLLFLLILPIAFPIMIFFYVFRRNLKYFVITMKNSATLSLINNDKVFDDNTLFHYDVFVSYCNEDRNWVLDYLLPNVENQNNASVCLHERDFQVGLSILENIVACMDRSRSIMLVLSRNFLKSQWCQFEMHLAQHRLLETRREDLILVLLEDIPRRMRPTTLHYLMLTKTYILWPKKESERPTFWRRLTRSLIARRQEASTKNISIA